MACPRKGAVTLLANQKTRIIILQANQKTRIIILNAVGLEVTHTDLHSISEHTFIHSELILNTQKME